MNNLKKQRSFTKGKITRIQTYAHGLNADSVVTIQELKIKLTTLDSAWTEYVQIQHGIVDLTTEDEMARENADFEEIETKHFTISSFLQQLIDERQEIHTNSEPSPRATNGATQDPDGFPNLNIAVGPVNPLSDIRLPRMNSPTFTGNQLEWQSFRDLFKSIIHNNRSIGDSQKLYYLKNSMREGARGLLESIDITDVNYKVSWDLLEERYDNERQLIFTHLHTLFSQPKMTTECPSKLRALLDTTTKHVRALKALGYETDHWDPIIVFLLCERLDSETRRHWDLTSTAKTFPVLGELKKFLEQRCCSLESTSDLKHKQNDNVAKQRPKAHVHVSTERQISVCSVCKSAHYIHNCPEFLSLQIPERYELVKKLILCFNCLRSGHSIKECKCKYRCRTCKAKHHSLLHKTDPKIQPPVVNHCLDSVTTPATSVQLAIQPTSEIINQCSSEESTSHVLLSTILIKVKDNRGNLQDCRALLDSRSQCTLITEACTQRLGLNKRQTTRAVSGIGQFNAGKTRGIVEFMAHSNTCNFSLQLNAMVLPKLTTQLPSVPILSDDWGYIRHLQLADPKFNTPGPIDVLIGADAYNDIVTCQKIEGDSGMPTARSTNFGWILLGKVDSSFSGLVVSHVAITDVGEQLKKFWELEEIGHQKHHTNEEKQCEAYFQQTHTRDETGRYVVSLPFKADDTESSLGFSKDRCMQRLCHVERRLENCQEYKIQYHDFMEKYLSLGHMEPIPKEERPEVLHLGQVKTNYLPHHFVLKQSSTSTAFRVVFDASAKTSTGISLNDKLLVGPRLQEDIYAILLRFRLFKYVFTADVAKMFRQIKMKKPDSDFQRILWRKSPELPIEEYRLTTVTYGTASAPYLATKALQQLAEDEGEKFPLCKQVILKDFYVDDVMSGNNNLDLALETQRQLIEITAKGGFPLRKWSSNHPALLECLPAEYRETSLPLSLDSDDSIKALGLHWNPASDHFFFKVNLTAAPELVTKRNILSETSKLFDPLGWVAPVIIIAKMIFQQLWLIGASWDDKLPDDVVSTWTEFRGQLFRLEEITIPRYAAGLDDSVYQLHGFCDASEKAYAAAIYLRTEREDGRIVVHLLTSKTKVAPVKQVSLPRLELCGALLVARLLNKVKHCIGLTFDSIHAWTDSTITLAWISRHPNRWVTFVANRVAEIHGLVDPTSWHYVPSQDNPADCASRGMLPEILLNHSLWWTGPTWLASDASNWPILTEKLLENPPEMRKVKALTVQLPTTWNLLDKFSSLTKLVRVTAYCKRFITNLRKQPSVGQAKPPVGQNKPLTTQELHQALIFWINHIQQREFASTIQDLENKKPCTGQIATLNPFIDPQGTLRVGGRLRHAKINFDQKYPILLPKKNQLTELIVVKEHISNLHAGPQLLLSILQHRFWIVNGRTYIRKLIHNCVKCVQEKGTLMQQQMGDLPPQRLELIRPFLSTGVDYAGPFSIKSLSGRGGKIIKGYISLFICFSTKAIHLEFVSDLTSEAFIAALRRFTSRRGKPADVFSDNGTNFVGADKELKKLLKSVHSNAFHQSISDQMTKEGTNWHFIPPGAPHFGGLWEAGVKSTKQHLRRVIGDHTLTFEEMSTLLTQIEACLNSRPLCSLTTDPMDPEALTPGHFLIGEPLTCIPDPDLTHLPINRLSRWQLLQQMKQHFWKRWHMEYLNSLQQRSKWLTKKENAKIGDLVLIKEDNISSQQWHMGKITEIHVGKDNLVRTVTLKTSGGYLKRPIAKLCLLPMDHKSVL